MELSDSMKEKIRQLGEAINDSLSNSPEINETIRKIKGEGFELFLILEATIGLNPLSEDGEGDRQAGDAPAEDLPAKMTSGGSRKGKGKTGGTEGPVIFRVSPDDQQFLRSLRISVDEADAEPDSHP